MEFLFFALLLSAILWWFFWRRDDKTTEIDFSLLPEHFVVFDLETTGRNPERNKILEIAAIRVNKNFDTPETFQAFVKIKGKVPDKVAKLTGITNEMIHAHGEPLEDVLQKFVEFIGDYHLVAFNAPFDMSFLTAALNSHGLHISNPVSCALDMARRAWPRRYSYKLSALAIDRDLGAQCHRALEDSRLAMHVYIAAVSKLKSIE